RSRDRLSGSDAGVRRHRAESDRAAARGDDRDDGELRADRACDRCRDQSAQSSCPAGGAMSMGKLAAFLRSCVATPFNIVLSILTVLLLAWLLPELIKWAIIDAVWSGNSSKACEGHDA